MPYVRRLVEPVDRTFQVKRLAFAIPVSVPSQQEALATAYPHLEQLAAQRQAHLTEQLNLQARATEVERQLLLTRSELLAEQTATVKESAVLNRYMPLPTMREEWTHDPIALAQIAEVMRRRAQRQPLITIADQLHISLHEVKRDLERGHRLYQEDILRNADVMITDSLSTFEQIQREAWQRIGAIPLDRNLTGVAALLARVQDAEWRRAQILGIGEDALRVKFEHMSEDDLRKELEAVQSELSIDTSPTIQPNAPALGPRSTPSYSPDPDDPYDAAFTDEVHPHDHARIPTE